LGEKGLKLADLMRVTAVTSPRLHPDGDGAVFVARRATEDGEGYTSHIVYADAGGSRTLTRGPHDGFPVFAADGGTLYFVRGDKERGDQVMALPMTGGEPSPFEPRFHGVTGLTPVPGRAAVVVAARGPGAPPAVPYPRHYRRFQWQYDGVGYFPETPVGLYWVEAGRDPVRLTDGPYDVEPAAVDPGGRFLLTAAVADEERAQEGNTDLFQASLPAGSPEGPLAWLRLTRGPGQFNRPAVAEDGRIYCFGDTQSHGPATAGSLFRVTDTGRVERIPVDDEAWIGAAIPSDWNATAGLARPIPTADGVMVVGSRRGRTVLFHVGDDGRVNETSLSVSVVHELDGGDRGLVFTGSGPESPVEAYAFRDGAVRALTSENVWARGRLWPLEQMEATSADGLSIPAYLVGDPSLRPGPTILYVHGGPHGAYGEAVRFDVQVMAGRGYQVLMVNPRGSMGYGQAFADAVRGDWGGKDREDLMTVVDLAIERGIADPEALFITGGSYGGFQTAFTVGHTNRFRAASTVVPVINLVSFYGTSDIGWWFTAGEIGGDPWGDLERLWDFSPLKYAARVRTPTQVMAAEDDRRCPIEQAEQYYTALKHFGVETEFLRYPGPHGFGSLATPKIRQDRLERLLGWFDAHR